VDVVTLFDFWATVVALLKLVRGGTQVLSTVDNDDEVICILFWISLATESSWCAIWPNLSLIFLTLSSYLPVLYVLAPSFLVVVVLIVLVMMIKIVAILMKIEAKLLNWWTYKFLSSDFLLKALALSRMFDICLSMVACIFAISAFIASGVTSI
jgi:hypothetical protein